MYKCPNQSKKHKSKIGKKNPTLGKKQRVYLQNPTADLYTFWLPKGRINFKFAALYGLLFIEKNPKTLKIH